MDFLTTFLASFSKAPLLPSGTPAESLLGHVYEEQTDNVYQPLLSIYAYGVHYVSLPFSYYIRSFNSYLILYQKRLRQPADGGQPVLPKGGNPAVFRLQAALFPCGNRKFLEL